MQGDFYMFGGYGAIGQGNSGDSLFGLDKRKEPSEVGMPMAHPLKKGYL